MTNPAMASDFPPTRPMLFLIFARDMCPRMIAGIPAIMESRVTDKTPKTRLPTAFPSVGGSGGTLSHGELPWEGGGTAAFEMVVPHAEQKVASSGILAPHFGQNIRASLTQCIGGEKLPHFPGNRNTRGS